MVKRAKWPEARPHFECRECINARAREYTRRPAVKVALAAQYRDRKARGITYAKPWADKTPQQRQAAAQSVKRFRQRTQPVNRALDRQYSALKRHPGYRFMLLAMREHYGTLCLCCKVKPGICTDHVVPMKPDDHPSLNDWPNLQLLCRGCNTQKRLLATDYRPDLGAWIVAHLALHPELSTQSLLLYRKPTVTRLGRRYEPDYNR